MNKDNNTKIIELEDLIAETEQKILNNEYYEDCEVPYKDAVIKVRIKPISQAEIVKISQNRQALKSAEFNSLILQKCIINKHDDKPFTLEQINKLFTGGLAAVLVLKCLEVSGISPNEREQEKLMDF